MRRSLRTRTGSGVLVAVAALVATALQTGSAAAAPVSVPTHEGVTSPTARQQLIDYWTPERMRSATPLDTLTADGATPAAVAGVARGERQTVAPTAADTAPRQAGTPKALPETGAEWTGGGAVATTAGRVFFTYQGQSASCSGDAVSSANGSTVLTAGHCVKLDGAWHTDWVFVPGYHDGQAPYGTWTAATTMSTPQWEASEDINYDVGAAVVDPLDGRRLTDVVGGQGVAFNGAYNTDMYAFGYPAQDPWDGESLIYSSGTSFQDPLLSTDHGLDSDLNGGASGGPWFTGFDEATGTGMQSSVNSFTYTFLPGVMFGPYFGDEAQALYNTAQAG